MYSMTTRVRYSEGDSDGILTIPALINYLQDCAIFHSEDVGFGVQYMLDQNTAWVLGSWQIDIEEMPHFGERLEIQSYPYRFRRFMGCRGYIVRSADEDKEYARANSVWSYIDLGEMKPKTAPDEMVAAYGLDRQLDMDYSSKKITVPEGVEGVVKPSITITDSHIDTNDHVNNGIYVQFASEYIVESAGNEAQIKRIRAEYKSPSYKGDVITPVVYFYDDTLLVTFQLAGNSTTDGTGNNVHLKGDKKDDKKILTSVEFSLKK